jgi:hypothetical protein
MRTVARLPRSFMPHFYQPCVILAAIRSADRGRVPTGRNMLR